MKVAQSQLEVIRRVVRRLGRPRHLQILGLAADHLGPQLEHEFHSFLGPEIGPEHQVPVVVSCAEPNWGELSSRLVPGGLAIVLGLTGKVDGYREQLSVAGLELETFGPFGFLPSVWSRFERLFEDTDWGRSRFLVARKPGPTDGPLTWAQEEEPELDLSLVIPFFNEEEGAESTLVNLLEGLREMNFAFELVAVDNGSLDQTSQLLTRLAESHPELRPVTVFPNRGYGWGILRGLETARGEHVGFMDGDGQVAPADVVRTFIHYRQTGVDLCKTRRVTRGDGTVRALVSVAYNLLFSMCTGYWENDANATPKFFARRHLLELQLSSRDWFIDAELLMKARQRGWQLAAVSIDFITREKGRSYISMGSVWEFLKNLARATPEYWKGRMR